MIDLPLSRGAGYLILTDRSENLQSAQKVKISQWCMERRLCFVICWRKYTTFFCWWRDVFKLGNCCLTFFFFSSSTDLLAHMPGGRATRVRGCRSSRIARRPHESCGAPAPTSTSHASVRAAKSRGPAGVGRKRCLRLSNEWSCVR